MQHLTCDKKDCKKLVYYVVDGYEGIEQAFCKEHGDKEELEVNLPRTIKYLQEDIRKITKQVKCHNSLEGHVFPKPIPYEPCTANHDIPSSGLIRMSNGTKACTKCNYTIHDPSTELNWNNNSLINVDGIELVQKNLCSMGVDYPMEVPNV